MKNWIVAFLTIFGICFAFNAELCADAIPADLLVSGEYLFDSASSEVFDSGSQSGTFYSVQGGSNSSSTYTDGAISSGTNPVGGILTQHGGGNTGQGDGFGGSSTASAGIGGRSDAVNICKHLDDAVVSNLDEPNLQPFGTAIGGDSWIRSDIEIDLDGNDAITAAEVISDVRGNFFDGNSTGEFGGLVEDSGVRQFNFVLNPLGLSQIEIDFTFEGAAILADGQIEGDASYFLSIDQVIAIPEPIATLPLIGLCLYLVRKRR